MEFDIMKRIERTKKRGKFSTVQIEGIEEKKRKNKVISLMNAKGGCGKTTTAMALGMYLVRTGSDVCFIDMDSQCNLTQRLEIHSIEELGDRKLNSIFHDPKSEPAVGTIIKFPYLQRIQGSSKKPGKVCLIPGHPDSTLDAEALAGKYLRGTAQYGGYTTIEDYYGNYVDFLRNFFDYIILDTAPALEGNILNRLALHVSNEIIYPIDGLEAAYGINTILSWMRNETKRINRKINGCFVMAKYQEDSISEDFLSTYQNVGIHNSVFQVLQKVYGDFVCKTGVKELKSLRGGTSTKIPGFGARTVYTPVCEELIRIINTPERDNLFEYATKNGTDRELLIGLRGISLILRKREPKFYVPSFKNPTEYEWFTKELLEKEEAINEAVINELRESLPTPGL